MHQELCAVTAPNPIFQCNGQAVCKWANGSTVFLIVFFKYIYNNVIDFKVQFKCLWVLSNLFTCPDKQDIILAILSFHSIHCYLFQVIFSICFYQYWFFMGRFYGLVHKRMASCKSNSIIGIVFGGSVPPSIYFAGTLKYMWMREFFFLP